MKENEDYESLRLKYEELKLQNKNMSRKLTTIENSGTYSLPKKDLLGLEPGKLYLIITEGRRILGKLLFEAKSFICYTKRDGTKYYANKRYMKLVKELTTQEQKTYMKSNFGELVEEDND